MRVMALTARGAGRLAELKRPVPDPAPHELLVKVLACGVCRTDLHVVDDELPDIHVPVVPGHEIVGRVERAGASVTSFLPGDRVGIPWLAWSCGACEFCAEGRENLCRRGRFTGYHVDGGYADYVIADAAFCIAIPRAYDDLHAAPLLCAGLIGYRAYRMTGAGRRLGIYGFGASAHIIAQVAVHQAREVYALVTPGDNEASRFALDVGATWSGASNSAPPVALDAAIIFAPVGSLIPAALSHVRPGGVVVCAGIHMSDVPSFPYRLLWEERIVRSVANLTRDDATAFMGVAAEILITTRVRAYPLTEANGALDDLRRGRLSGAAVLVP
jgi:propanol-preferring alcohol dehydrogenase